jgi:hypothetical protein
MSPTFLPVPFGLHDGSEQVPPSASHTDGLGQLCFSRHCPFSQTISVVSFLQTNSPSVQTASTSGVASSPSALLAPSVDALASVALDPSAPSTLSVAPSAPSVVWSLKSPSPSERSVPPADVPVVASERELEPLELEQAIHEKAEITAMKSSRDCNFKTHLDLVNPIVLA